MSAAAATFGTATTTATYSMGTGATPNGVSKILNLCKGGASRPNTVVNIDSAMAGAGGSTIVNTLNVTFANAVMQIGMPQAHLAARMLGLGRATAERYNRLSFNAPAMLFNKNAAGNDAAFALKTGFSARALIRLLGNDDFGVKVSPDGSASYDALKIDHSSGGVKLSEPLLMPSLPTAPVPPPAGKLAVYARERAGPRACYPASNACRR